MAKSFTLTKKNKEVCRGTSSLFTHTHMATCKSPLSMGDNPLHAMAITQICKIVKNFSHTSSTTLNLPLLQ